MSRSLADLPGIGPKTAARLHAAGIDTETRLRELGAAAAYCRIKREDPREVTLNALWALHGALAGLHWTDLSRETKANLLAEVRSDLNGGPG